jgi:hypothetical protein
LLCRPVAGFAEVRDRLDGTGSGGESFAEIDFLKAPVQIEPFSDLLFVPVSSVNAREITGLIERLPVAETQRKALAGDRSALEEFGKDRFD